MWAGSSVQHGASARRGADSCQRTAACVCNGTCARAVSAPYSEVKCASKQYESCGSTCVLAITGTTIHTYKQRIHFLGLVTLTNEAQYSHAKDPSTRTHRTRAACGLPAAARMATPSAQCTSAEPMPRSRASGATAMKSMRASCGSSASTSTQSEAAIQAACSAPKRLTACKPDTSYGIAVPSRL